MIEVTRQIGRLTLIPDAIFDTERLDANHKMAYIYLCRFEQYDNVTVSAEEYLSKMLSVSMRRVDEILIKLQNENIIEKTDVAIDLISPHEWKWLK